MIWALLARIWSGFVWPVLKISIPIPVFAVLAVFVWWQIDKTSSIRHAVNSAVESYTHTVELTAAEAKIAELQRQIAENEKANAWLRIQIADDDAKAAAAEPIQQKNDSDYDSKLKANGRGCTLDDVDIDWLRDGR